MSGTKVCSKCHTTKDLEDFCVDRKNSDGLSSHCLACRRDYWYAKQARLGKSRMSYQTPGEQFIFRCGCSGTLPQPGQTSKFAMPFSRDGEKSAMFKCRVAYLLRGSQAKADERNHTAISMETPHSVIRAMMEEPNCVLCSLPLTWEFGMGKTPHLHHNHVTGEIYGFTHARCNAHDLMREIDRLRDQIKTFSHK